MNNIDKTVPDFRIEKEERIFWETNDSADRIDWSKAERVRLPNLKRSTTASSPHQRAPRPDERLT
jgi:CopG antitoxin of type II toxin-antitoxin system